MDTDREIIYHYVKGKGWVAHVGANIHNPPHSPSDRYYLMVWLPSFKGDPDVGGWGGWVQNSGRKVPRDYGIMDLKSFYSDNAERIRDCGWEARLVPVETACYVGRSAPYDMYAYL